MKFPLTPLEVEKYLKKALGYEISFAFLFNVYNNVNAGTAISDLFSASELDKLYAAIAEGYSIKATGTNAVVSILTAECEEIASDDFRCVEIAFIYDAKHITLAFSRFGTGVYVDNKVVKEL